jgi:hypothetical protein
MAAPHPCPGGCGRSIPHHRLACRADWYRLPRELRLAITSAYGGPNEPPNPAHRAAVADAVMWYRKQGTPQ